MRHRGRQGVQRQCDPGYAGQVQPHQSPAVPTPTPAATHKEK